MHLSTYLQELVAEYVRGADFPTTPVSLELALSASDPLDDGSGLSEPPALDGYARQTITFDPSVATLGSGVAMLNSTPIVFGPVTNNTWPTVTHVAIFDSASNLLFHGPMNVQRTSPVGDQIPFAAGALQVQSSQYFSQYFGQLMLEWVRGTAPAPAPSTTELALSRADPLEDGSGLDEPSVSFGYLRESITFSAPGSTASGTPIVSDGPYVLGPATSDWGLITHAAVFGDGTNQLFQGPMAVQRTLLEDDAFAVQVGALTLLVT